MLDGWGEDYQIGQGMPKDNPFPDMDPKAGDKAQQERFKVAPDTHWVFFETIDEDLHAYSRNLEFHDENLRAFSANLARPYFVICSEVDVIAKQYCEREGEKPKNQWWSIGDYRRGITG